MRPEDLKKFTLLMMKVASTSSGIEEARNTQSRMEQQLHESWESLLEKVEKPNAFSYSPTDYPQEFLGENKCPGDGNAPVNQSPIIDIEFIHNQSSYLQGLPSMEPGGEGQKESLRRMYHYEKHIFP